MDAENLVKQLANGCRGRSKIAETIACELALEFAARLADDLSCTSPKGAATHCYCATRAERARALDTILARRALKS